jgi:predicted HTH transcriptional regulator
MTKEELIQKLSEIEWDDFECKAAQDKLPEDVWETVSAFSNTSGGWIVFGIKQRGKQFEIQGGEQRGEDGIGLFEHSPQRAEVQYAAVGSVTEIQL